MHRPYPELMAFANTIVDFAADNMAWVMHGKGDLCEGIRGVLRD